jgi:hypothetical protein
MENIRLHRADLRAREDYGIYAALQIGRNSTLEVRRMILDLIISIMAAIIMTSATVLCEG